MTGRVRRTLIGTLLAAAVTATLGLTITGSQAATSPRCVGGGYESVCANLYTFYDSVEKRTEIKAWGKARYLSTRHTYKLKVRLERCTDTQEYCAVKSGPTSKVRSGVSAFTHETSPGYSYGSGWCYKSFANLYRQRSDGSWDYLTTARQVWC